MSEGMPIVFDLIINAIECFHFMIELGRVFNKYMDDGGKLSSFATGSWSDDILGSSRKSESESCVPGENSRSVSFADETQEESISEQESSMSESESSLPHDQFALSELESNDNNHEYRGDVICEPSESMESSWTSQFSNMY